MVQVWPMLIGRWQPFHNGHLWVVNKVINKYGKIAIAIVNIDPSNPPDVNFDRFFPTANPFGYWDRYYMLMNIFNDKRIWDKIRLVPAWHPRVKVQGENYCFPPKNRRVWIVPLTSDEEEKKARDFSDRREKVEIISQIPEEILKYNAVKIRQLIVCNNEEWRQYIPQALFTIENKIHFTDKIKIPYTFSRLSDRHSQTNVRTAILIGWFCPITLDHIKLIIRLLEKYDIVTIFPILEVADNSPINWPVFNYESENCSLNFWERSEVIRIIERENELFHNRLIILPLLVKNNQLIINYEYLPTQRKWYILNENILWACKQLSTDGESVEEMLFEKKLSDIWPLREDKLSKKQIEYLKNIGIDWRLTEFSDEKKEEGTMKRGIHFWGNVSIEGNVVNIEGNQYNLLIERRENVISMVVNLIKSDLPNKDIINLVQKISKGINSRSDISKEEITERVKDGLSSAIKKHQKRRKLQELMEQLAISSAGSMLVLGIIQGIRFLLSGG